MFLFYSAAAQKNLVPNPSFEEPVPTAPSTYYNVSRATHQELVKHWYNPTKGSPDYYNSDRSTVAGISVKKARSGEGRAGLILKTKVPSEYTEYIETKLTEPLIAGRSYVVKMYYALDKRCLNYSKSVGICLTPHPLRTEKGYTLPIMSHLTHYDVDDNSRKEGWTEFKFIYRAEGGEEYLTLGSFDTRPSLPILYPTKEYSPTKLDLKSDFSDYAYYYFDDVCVQELENDCKDCCHYVLPKREDKSFNNFVFMVDVSSSMTASGYLEDVKKSVLHLADSLGKNDYITLISFDGNSKVLEKKIKASDKDLLMQAIKKIVPGNTSTNVDKAIEKAYQIIDSTLIRGGNNHAVLVSDAQFKLAGNSSRTIKQHYKKQQVAFTMVQFGNKKNKAIEKVSQKTNGGYTNVKENQMASALDAHIKRPGQEDYTEERKELRVYRTLFRVGIGALVVGAGIVVLFKVL